MNTKTTKKCLFVGAVTALFAAGVSMEVQASAYTLDRRASVLETVSSVVPGLPEWEPAKKSLCVRLKSLGLGNIFLHNIQYASVDRENLSAVIDGREMRQSKMLDGKLREQLWNGLHGILPKYPLKNLIIIDEPTCLDFSQLSYLQGMYLINTEFPGKTFVDFAKNLKGNTTLNSLYFEHNNITDITVSFLAASLVGNDTLKYLCFKDCNLTNQVFIAYSLDNILMNTSVTHMSVSGSIGETEAIRIIAAAVLRRCLEGRPLELFDAGKVEGKAVEYLHLLKKIVSTDIRFQSSVPDARGEMSVEEIVNEAIGLGLLAEESREIAETFIKLNEKRRKYDLINTELQSSTQNQKKCQVQMQIVEQNLRQLARLPKTSDEKEKTNIAALQQKTAQKQIQIRATLDRITADVNRGLVERQQISGELEKAEAAYERAQSGRRS